MAVILREIRCHRGSPTTKALTRVCAERLRQNVVLVPRGYPLCGLLLCQAAFVMVERDVDDVAGVLVLLAGDLAGERPAGLGAAVQLELMAVQCRELGRELVLDALEKRRVSWVTVGRSFGTSRQAAQKRFGRKGG